MNKSLFFSVLVATLILLPGQSFADNAPHKIGGFALGQQISTFVDLVRMESAMPIRDQQYLQIVEIGDLYGYKSGNIAFGNCAHPGQIVRIKLKYENSDKEFYNELLDQFKKRFGEPDEWRGDPFHVIVAWKWSFKDKDNNKISLTLQYSRDEDYKWGNSVKLTNTTLVEQERTCYDKKHAGKSADQKGKSSSKRKKLEEKDYQRFIPE
ncbi:MAG: hypothetical protein LJE87_15045 [Deltaproteobacteria bacterium]|nr:hypothetical protein [Deltaproteobacteria bacterium]